MTTPPGPRPGEGPAPARSDASRPAPILETGRLRLRPWRKSDFRPYYAILCEPAVFRHFGPEPMTLEDCWRRMCATIGQWAMNGFGGWAVEDRATAKLLGSVALFTAWRGLDPEFGEEPEMGWIMATEAHGRGLAHEACRAVLAWADEQLAPTNIWAIVAPGNEPSLKLADRLGFQVLGSSEYHGESTVVLKRSPGARPIEQA